MTNEAAERFEYALSVIEPVMPQLTDAVRVAHREALAAERRATVAVIRKYHPEAECEDCDAILDAPVSEDPLRSVAQGGIGGRSGEIGLSVPDPLTEADHD